MPSTAAGMCLILVQLLVLVHLAAGYSLDEQHSLEFSGPAASMFGFSVLLHQHKDHRWSDFYFLLILCWSTADLFMNLLLTDRSIKMLIY